MAVNLRLSSSLALLIAGHVLIRIGLRAMLVGALASQFAGALAPAT